jgi:eukaryotic-like serine/threonine-protein kinase
VNSHDETGEVPPASGVCDRCGGVVVLGRSCPRCTLAWVMGQGRAVGGEASRRMGGFALFEELGRGGMGRVWRARQEGLEREVAVKTLWGGALADAGVRERFRREALAAGRLNHPGIVSVFGVGEEAGELYLAMELVRGGSLADRLRRGAMGSQEAARLIRDLALAVDHAHRNGIVHRDLKPSNVLLDSERGGIPRLTDFGIARLLESDRMELTVTGEGSGSPAYVSPEQAVGDRAAQGVATDVYGLGAVLYHALTGRPPFAGDSAAATIRWVVERDPIPPRTLIAGLPRDLETICLKCLEKVPSRRYPSAAEVAEELERFLKKEPVRACPPGMLGRCAKWVRRNPLAAALVCVGLLGLATTSVQWLRAERAGDAVERQLSETENARAVEFIEDGRVREALAVFARTLRRDPTEFFAGNRLSSLLLRRLWARPRFVVEVPARTVEALAWSPAHRAFVAACDDGVVRRWDEAVGGWDGWHWMTGAGGFKWVGFSAGGEWVGALRKEGYFAVATTETPPRIFQPVREPELVVKAAFHPHANRLAVALADHRFEVWDLETEERLWSAVLGERATGMLWSPDGTRLVLSGIDGVIAVHDAVTGLPVGERLREAFPVVGIDLHPGGEILVATTREGSAAVWELATGRRFLAVRQGTLDPARFNRSGHLVRFLSDGRSLVVGEVDERKSATFRLSGVTMPETGWTHARGVDRAVLSGGGRNLILVDLGKGEVKSEPILTPGAVTAMGLHPDGRRLAFSASPGEIEVWSVGSAPLLPARALVEKETLAAQFRSDSAAAMVVNTAGELVSVGLEGEASRAVVSAPVFRPANATFSADATWVALASAEGTVSVHRTADGTRVGGPWEHASAVESLCFSPDRRWLVVGTKVTGATVHGLQGAEAVRREEGTRGVPVTAIEVSPDSSWMTLVAGEYVRCLRLDGSGTGHAWAHPAVVTSATFHPQVTSVVTSARDGKVRVWDLKTGMLAPVGYPHDDDAMEARFSPDGRVLVTVGVDRHLRIWDAVTGRSRAVATAPGPLRRVSFDPDGRRVATTGDRSRGPVIDVLTGQGLTESLTSKFVTDHARFSPDGRWLLRWTENREANVYGVPVVRGPAPEVLMELAEAMAGFAYGMEGVLVPVTTRQRIEVENRIQRLVLASRKADYWTELLRKVLHEE